MVTINKSMGTPLREEDEVLPFPRSISAMFFSNRFIWWRKVTTMVAKLKFCVSYWDLGKRGLGYDQPASDGAILMCRGEGVKPSATSSDWRVQLVRIQFDPILFFLFEQNNIHVVFYLFLFPFLVDVVYVHRRRSDWVQRPYSEVLFIACNKVVVRDKMTARETIVAFLFDYFVAFLAPYKL